MSQSNGFKITAEESMLRKAILSFIHKELSGPAIMRTLVEHRSWRIHTEMTPSGPVPKTTKDEDGQLWLQAFSDRDLDVQNTDDPNDLVLEVNGAALFRMTGDVLHGIELNQDHETAIHFSKKQFRHLDRWAEAIEIEKLLGSDEPLEAHRERLVGCPRLLILAQESAAGMHSMRDGRYKDQRIVAVFTADDCVERFKKAATEMGHENLRIRAYTGFALFQELENLAVDGCVFNPEGPAPTVLKDAAFIRTMVGLPGLYIDDLLRARNVAEAHLYLDMLGCPPGRRNHKLVDYAGHLVSQYTCEVPHKDLPTVFHFIVESKDMDTTGFGGAAPSRIIDPAAFLRYSDRLAQSVPSSPKGLSEQQIKQNKYILERAAACVDEVLKFLPVTDDELSEDAFFSVNSASIWVHSPQRFNRLRLQAIATTYRNIANTFTNDGASG